LSSDLRREPEARLVEEQERRLGHQPAPKCQHLLLAAGKRARRLHPPLLEMREHFIHAREPRRPSGPRPRRVSAEVEILFDGEIGKHEPAFRHERNALRNSFRRCRGGELAAVVGDAAALQRQHAGQCAHQRALAGAVGAEHCRDCAGFDGDVDAVQHHHVAIA
jgi:hypothetical protein